MKRTLLSIAAFSTITFICNAQGAIDAYTLSQPDLKGTARYMGMAGAFGALGGDISAITQNPAGIGVYRSSDVGFTLDLDLQSSSTMADGLKYNMNQTKFLLNNIGAVLTMRLSSTTVPNLNFGFVYNKGVSFNRVFGGNINTLHNSMSNYIAGIANSDGLMEGDVATSTGYDPYNPPYGTQAPPWLTVLGYDSYLITPDVDPTTGRTKWYGLWDTNSMTGQNTTGSGSFLMKESGGVNDFNIVLGGNISNILYWGMNFDVINVNYNLNALWGESLDNALVPDATNQLVRERADWSLNNLYKVSGTGFNYQLGLIVKPVQEFRLGFAFHTPTWYNLSEEFGASVDYTYGGSESGTVVANDGYLGTNNFNLRTPWRIIASAAGVIGSNLILSFDYEWANYGTMHLSEPNYNNGYYDWDYPWYYNNGNNNNVLNYGDSYIYENADISNYYKSTNTFRVGLEFKPVQALSLRAGYSFVSSPVKAGAKNNEEIIYTAGTQPSYRFDNNTNYITAGLGFRSKRFYADLAYVYKHMNSTFHAYTPDPENPRMPSPQSNVDFTNNQVVLTMGIRF